MSPSLPLLILAALFIQSAYGHDENNRNRWKARLFGPRSRLNNGQPWFSDAILNKRSKVETTITSAKKPVTNPSPTDISYPENTYPTSRQSTNCIITSRLIKAPPPNSSSDALDPATYRTSREATCIIIEPPPPRPPDTTPPPVDPPPVTPPPDALDPAVNATKEEEKEKEQYKEDKGVDEDDEYIFGLRPNTAENADKDLIEFNDPLTRRTKRRQMANKRRNDIQRRRFTNEHHRRIHRRMKRIDSQKSSLN